ncbi:RNA-directed DNA polymerase [Brevibacterium aurantiacum]|nr:RNA-directed DNA polymerase [Brevibacterium aurantiacum]
MAQESLWTQLMSVDSLEKITDEVLHGSKVRGRDGMQPTRVLEERREFSLQLSRKVLNNEYFPVSYRSKLKSKGARSAPRQISIPAARDRAVIKAVQLFLKQCFPEINPTLPQVSVARLLNELESSQYKYYVRVDIQNFYPSIEHAYLIDQLKQRIRVPGALNVTRALIETATTSDNVPRSGPNTRGIPQGLAVSSLLSEIALSQLDRQMRQTPGLYYCRYVDDLLILSRRQQHLKLFSVISGLIRPVGLRAHPMEKVGSKTTHGQLTGRTDRVDYLGYKLGISVNSPSVRNASVQNLERKISKIFADYKKRPRKTKSARYQLQYNLNLIITGCVYGGHKRGWLQYYSLMRDFPLLHRLDNFVQKKVKAYGLEGEIGVKTFVKSFRFAARRAIDTSGYVPNFDQINLTGKRSWLVQHTGFTQAQVRRMVRDRVDREFDFHVSKLLSDMEEDLAIAY